VLCCRRGFDLDPIHWVLGVHGYLHSLWLS
jgi:hypothetical protein